MRLPCLASILALVFAATSAQAESLHGRIVGVTDGDTISLLVDDSRLERIRLAGIDSPEKRQDFGQKAKAQLSDLAFGRDADADCQKRDRYQRLVCVVTVDGEDIGLAQIKAGMAWVYRQYIGNQTAKQRADYEYAEATAKAGRLGLWQQPNAVPPREWRRGRRLVD